MAQVMERPDVVGYWHSPPLDRLKNAAVFSRGFTVAHLKSPGTCVVQVTHPD
jgi:hypothetical protein